MDETSHVHRRGRHYGLRLSRLHAFRVKISTFKVKGVEGLRVIDASTMPSIISANTNATVMAVADRSVDLMMRT